ncbi:MAG: Uma2 family endonuclease [Phototrophicaceae bacterium]
MSALPQPTHFTEAEYHALQNGSERKFEYLDGEIVARVGASEAHILICMNLYAHLHSQLKGSDCLAFSSDLRVKIQPNTSYVYPDLTVVCGQRLYTIEQALLNPTLIIEVLSPSTAQYDRTVKRALYQQLPSLRAYLMIAQDQALIEVIERAEQLTWTTHQWGGLDHVGTLPSLGLSFPSQVIYENVL